MIGLWRRLRRGRRPAPGLAAGPTDWRRTRQVGLRAALAAAAMSAMPGIVRADSPSILRPASPNAAEITHLYLLIFYIGVGVFILVEALILYAVIKFRRKSPDEQPEQVHGNTRVEIAWTIVPAVIVLGLAAVSHRTLVETFQPPADALTIEVFGHQWWWEFDYPPSAADGDAGFATATEVHVPVGHPVIMLLDSKDVIHSFWVPELAGKTDAIPGERDGGYGQTRVWFEPTEVGKFEGQCAEYCGTQHSGMRFTVFVDTAEDYQAWRSAMAKPAAAPPAGSDAAAGLALMSSKGCQGCHSVDGVETLNGLVGPNLTHVASRGRLAGGIYDNTDANKRAWISDPAAVKPGTLMPKLPLTPTEIDQVVAYLDTLK